MIRFVEKPHLPQGEVRQIIIGEKYKNVLENALFEQNIAPIWFKNNDFVDERLSGHCDLMTAHLGGNRLAVQSSVADNCKLINNIELICTENPSRPEYPYDAGLNICIVDEKLIYNPKSANMQIVSQFEGTKLICKQGYTKCSICVVDENSIIKLPQLCQPPEWMCYKSAIKLWLWMDLSTDLLAEHHLKSAEIKWRLRV